MKDCLGLTPELMQLASLIADEVIEAYCNQGFFVEDLLSDCTLRPFLVEQNKPKELVKAAGR